MFEIFTDPIADIRQVSGLSAMGTELPFTFNF